MWIRIDGKGSYENSVHLRAFTQCELERGQTRFVLDLDKCPGMDSTFMGTLLAISKDVRKVNSSDGIFDIINTNQRNIQLLKSLGLNLLLSIDENNSRWDEERREVGQTLEEAEVNRMDVDKTTKAEVMLEAHEALASAQPENHVRFKDVIHYLKSDLQAKRA